LEESVQELVSVHVLAAAVNDECTGGVVGVGVVEVDFAADGGSDFERAAGVDALVEIDVELG
jgi:hypothetical protein